MAARRSLLSLLVLSLLLLPTLGLGPPPALASPTGSSARTITAQAGTARLNEVMPKAAEGDFEWVEIHNPQSLYDVFLPLMVRSYAGETRSVGVSAPAPRALVDRSVDISGWQVSDGDGNGYTFPEALPPIPPDAFVLVRFDGQGAGADDYDLSDGVAVLHSPPGMVDLFEDDADEVALYAGTTHTPDTIRDFVAWGGSAGGDDDDAVAAGLWADGDYVEFAASAGFVADWDADLRLVPGESAGRHPTETTTWAIYRDDGPTPGAENSIPRPGFFMPAAGGAVDASQVVVAWSVIPHATSYRFQLASSPDFSTSLVDTTTPYPDYHHAGALTPGTYYWRVRVNDATGSAGPWTAPAALNAVDLTGDTFGIQAEVTLGIEWQVQHKDTYLLDVSEEGENTRTGDGAWDVPHPDDRRVVEHDNHYCQVASMSMINSYYGSDISQDRLSYYAIREWPDSSRGLDPDRECTDPSACRPDVKDDFWAGRNKGLEAMVWMLGYDHDDFSDVIRRSYDPPTSTLPFEDIRTWIDAGRPLMVIKPGHVMVIDGYRTGDIDQVHLLDPWSAASWKPYTDTGSIQKINWVAVYPAPGTPPAPRSDEASVWNDSDGDGVYDFDELRRFHTDPYDPDTDGDWVRDKDDIEETVYDRFDNHFYTPARADWDGDGDRKELDWDNDADTSPDGCEDTDYDGVYEPFRGETHNFAIGDYQPCEPQLDILFPLTADPVDAGDPASPDKLLVQVSTAVPDPWPLSLTRHDFTVEIGGDSATVISAYPSGDTHWLVVQPPAKSASYYDLTVRLSGQSDTESDAVYYLAGAAESSALILDRSGSMGYEGKLEAAQNAASAFVDFLDDGDEVGVTSFGSTANVEYGLREIVNASVRYDAIAAVDSLTATGTTALGQGVQAGYGELASAATSDNRWSLVLLTDGHENVAPYWDDVSASVTDAVVHTVALGEEADRALLQRIAGEKHGRFFAVDLAPPSTLVSSEALAAAPLEVAQELPNRLADTYVAIGELEQREQRLWDAMGSASTQEQIPISVEVEEGLPEAIFTLNWGDPLGYLSLSLTDPQGNSVSPDAELRSDTHHQLRVANPTPGTWTATVEILKPTPEYHLMLSGKSTTTLIAAVGGDPEAHAPGEPVPIYGILSDNAPIAGATVEALVTGPQRSATRVQLYDDGAHGDGQAGDGLYANQFVPDLAGGYGVKLAAEGTNNQDDAFRRYAHAGFNVRHLAAYVWDDGYETALDYAALLEGSDWLVDLIRLPDVPTTDFTPYSFIIVAPETGAAYDFDDPAARDALAQLDKPFLGLGNGGAALFSEFDLNIGYGSAWLSTNNEVYPVAPATSYWNHPYPIDANVEFLIALYPEPLYELGVYLPSPLKTVTAIAREAADANHYPVIQEQRATQEFLLWGYNAGPRGMTEDGRALLVNLTHALR